jgi:thermostable 8-oxoguanine DNA glycosylase
MITISEIKKFRKSSLGEETRILKKKLTLLHLERKPFYLTSAEFDEILKWKLGVQYSRQQNARKVNTEEIIRSITGLALNICHPDIDYELELRIGILSSIRGVGVPVASAILALIYPDKYGVIDFRVWRQIFGNEATNFTISDYKKYMRVLRGFSLELGWSVQEVDIAIWTYDQEHNIRS